MSCFLSPNWCAFIIVIEHDPGRVLEHRPFGIPFDVSALAATAVMMAAAGLVATWAPVRYASGKDPAAALKDV